MATKANEPSLTPNEAACVTGVPLKQVHRIIDASLLGETVKRRGGGRAISRHALVGLKLAHETTEILTLNGRQRLVRHALDDPGASTVRENGVSVDLRPIKSDVRRGLTALDKASKMIVSDKDILGGTPCFKGTRIPVHDIADMLAHGDDAAAILAAYPTLTESQVRAAPIYSEAYPRRGRPRRQPPWRKTAPHASSEVKLAKLLRAS